MEYGYKLKGGRPTSNRDGRDGRQKERRGLRKRREGKGGKICSVPPPTFE